MVQQTAVTLSSHQPSPQHPGVWPSTLHSWASDTPSTARDHPDGLQPLSSTTHRQLIKMLSKCKKKGCSTSSFITMAMPQGIGTLNTVKANYKKIHAG